MPTRAEELYKSLRNASAIKSLINETEDAHLDCKEWPLKDDDAQKMLAKAVCGLANAEGGVLLIGMKAESRPKDEPDVITAPAPVLDVATVKSRVLNLVGNLVEPGVAGVNAEAVRDGKGAKGGFVVVLVPPSDGPPHRSRKDWKFYQRIGSGTFPMEYFQIEEMFGRRPRPKLSLILIEEGIQIVQDCTPHRFLRLGLKNNGRGIARFPSIRFRNSIGIRPALPGLDGNGSEALPRRPSEYQWIIYQGGIDSVVYPGEDFMITKVVQDGERRGQVGPEMHENAYIAGSRTAMLWRFPKIDFSCEISCEGAAAVEERVSFAAEDYRQEVY